MKLTGAHGWLALGAFVVAWDLTAPETLSSAFARAPWWAKLAGLGFIAAHLLDLIPEERDPLSLVARRVGR